MGRYLITYDLNNPGQNYSSIISKINLYTNSKVCESTWIIKSTKSCSEIANELNSIIDTNDRLFVAQLTGTASWNNSISSSDEIKKILN